MTTINISVKLLAAYRKYLPPEAEGQVFHTQVPAGAGPIDILTQFDVPILNNAGVVLVNGRTRPQDYVLQEGDVVCAFPAVGGGSR